MKWAITDDELKWGMESLYAPPISGHPKKEEIQHDQQRETRSFTRYKSREELKEDVDLHYHMWYSRKFEYTFRSLLHYRIFKKHYEIYVGGYLTYFDYVVNEEKKDHSLYFEWPEFSENDENQKKEYKVQVFIKLNPEPWSKSDNGSGKQFLSDPAEKVNGALADPPSPYQVDPKPPPGPPPPEP